MLDFSRIEAGRSEASFEPVDLGAFTTELASNFRSVCERAGLNLVVELPVGPGAGLRRSGNVEKIVLNLVSNAFKFTLHGGITIAVRLIRDAAELVVSDTVLASLPMNCRGCLNGSIELKDNAGALMRVPALAFPSSTGW